jgi:hypothetical protein
MITADPISGRTPWMQLRRLLLASALAGCAGTGAELLLLGHTEGWQQLVPIALLALAVGALLWHPLSGQGIALKTLKAVMWLCIISGAAGVALHFQGNVEFELEMYPEMRGVELLSETMTGATPVLAPGTMVLLGIVGLAYAFASTQVTLRNTLPEDDQ